MQEDQLARIREAIRGESLSGWLFYNFHHRDTLSDGILGIAEGASNTRPWAYLVPESGEPLKITHAVEARILDHLPGTAANYVERKEFFRPFERFRGQRWGAHLSPELPVLSFLDAGTAREIEARGLSLASAAALIQRLKGLLNEEGIASHERAADGLYGIVEETGSLIREAYESGKTIDEGTVRRFMLEGMDRRGLITDHPPIVAAGSHTGDPHYDFAGSGAAFRDGDVIQLDLWAKEKAPGSIYADISWVVFFGPEPDDEVRRAWKALAEAREEALRFAEAAMRAGKPPEGAAVDARVRERLIGAGYEAALRHRTGHGIDTECHGAGVNLDSVEFPDRRLLLEGSCFSVEPGLYFPRFGLRTEIDVYIRKGLPRVSGKERQREILCCPRSSV